MTGNTFQFDFRDLNLTVDQIERVMGYPEGESHETIYDIVAKVMKEAEAICDLKAEYRIFHDISCDDQDRKMTVEGTVLNTGSIIYRQIKKSDAVALFVCTAGKEIEERSRRIMKECDVLEGYILDIVGSAAVEAVADLMQDDLEQNVMSSGRKISNRFSPGYCGWDVVEQHKLFSLLPGNFCGISLTPSALMNPVKSVSGIIGIGVNVKRKAYTCKFCKMENCIYRRRE
ncbi:MAG TPA: vitamin B12 dependent-methionine synthase activation domain-containing protein [Bacteroidales bacterium]|nr:vitamin B12 dependent-methionine synthase activation domain-containing protein [Bacteroidales bacterium]HPF02383.1 vitamin B12 dependent-methionine synthase activation domain-containing protein [Bacteroidales bacterium]HPJ58934.1 vitamin B12 dependent-methionine synthase activation domain-containing protein [Bacteroidales bacterium]HPR12188.1 vitamin B12 dependent-methionine synthase activation domain-containing protein [Bacteroidales bacterium]HRW84871.1 vitamin B12 dependent-methionine syn